MSINISINEIPVFVFFEGEARDKLGEILEPQIRTKGERLLTRGREVEGLYVIVEGLCEVSIPNMSAPLAVLSRGQCVGEMSLLLDEVEAASADVIVTSDDAKLFFCSATRFQDFLINVPGSAAAFYQGASYLLSTRLRLVNSRLSEQLAVGHNLITDFIKDSEVHLHLSETRSELSQTGDTVVGKLMQLVPFIQGISKNFPDAQQELEALQNKIEEIFLIDSQNFDRISQQLDLITQHFENLQRVANGGQAVPLRGDRSLFQKTLKSAS